MLHRSLFDGIGDELHPRLTQDLALKGLHAAYNIKREIPDVPLKGVQLDLTMTLPPRVSISFVNNVVAAA